MAGQFGLCECLSEKLTTGFQTGIDSLPSLPTGFAADYGNGRRTGNFGDEGLAFAVSA